MMTDSKAWSWWLTLRCGLGDWLRVWSWDSFQALQVCLGLLFNARLGMPSPGPASPPADSSHNDAPLTASLLHGAQTTRGGAHTDNNVSITLLICWCLNPLPSVCVCTCLFVCVCFWVSVLSVDKPPFHSDLAGFAVDLLWLQHLEYGVSGCQTWQNKHKSGKQL